MRQPTEEEKAILKKHKLSTEKWLVKRRSKTDIEFWNPRGYSRTFEVRRKRNG